MKVPYTKSIHNFFQGPPNPGSRSIKVQTQTFFKRILKILFIQGSYETLASLEFRVSNLTQNSSETGHFSIMKKLRDLKKVFSNLELEGQGCGIIMGVTRLLLLGPFYTIQTNFMYFFAQYCMYDTVHGGKYYYLNLNSISNMP